MLHQFLSSNREKLIEHCRTLAVGRGQAPFPAEEQAHGIPVFFSQLIQTLRDDEANDSTVDSAKPTIGQPEKQRPTTLSNTAKSYGEELLMRGYTIDQVVHAYGDVCQAVTDLANKTHTPIAAGEFKIFNLCLDNAIAAAVKEFDRQRDREVRNSGNIVLNAQLQHLAQELRTNVGTVMLAIAVVRRGTVGMNGATASIIDSTLIAMRDLCDETLIESRTH